MNEQSWNLSGGIHCGSCVSFTCMRSRWFMQIILGSNTVWFTTKVMYCTVGLYIKSTNWLIERPGSRCRAIYRGISRNPENHDMTDVPWGFTFFSLLHISVPNFKAMWKIQNEIAPIHSFATFYDMIGMAWLNGNFNNRPNSGAYAIFWLISAFVIISLTLWPKTKWPTFSSAFFSMKICLSW